MSLVSTRVRLPSLACYFRLTSRMGILARSGLEREYLELIGMILS
jgi:hypothetical protein